MESWVANCRRTLLVCDDAPIAVQSWVIGLVLVVFLLGMTANVLGEYTNAACGQTALSHARHTDASVSPMNGQSAR
ncbi:hypothetical protein D3C76_1710560 [compost metagenome]